MDLNFYETTHLAKVTKVNSNPVQITELNHAYSVDVILLDDSQLAIPSVLITTPIAGTNDRGLFGAPSVGQLVEVGFINANARWPVIRSCIPLETTNTTSSDEIKLSKDSQQLLELSKTCTKLSHSATIFLEQNATSQTMKATKVFIGNEINLLLSISTALDAVAAALDVLATHTHPSVAVCSQGGDITAQSSYTKAQTAMIKNITL